MSKVRTAKNIRIPTACVFPDDWRFMYQWSAWKFQLNLLLCYTNVIAFCFNNITYYLEIWYAMGDYYH